mgnify:CR=1 FL=1
MQGGEPPAKAQTEPHQGEYWVALLFKINPTSKQGKAQINLIYRWIKQSHPSPEPPPQTVKRADGGVLTTLPRPFGLAGSGPFFAGRSNAPDAKKPLDLAWVINSKT